MEPVEIASIWKGPAGIGAGHALESCSLLQLLNAEPDLRRDRAQAAATSPTSMDLPCCESLIQVIRREGLDRIEGDFLEIGCLFSGGTAKLANHAKSVGKLAWVIQQNSKKAELPQGLRVAFAFVDGTPDPAAINSDFRLIWKHLVAGGWAAFYPYAGDLPEVTAAINTLITDFSADIDRVERIKKWRVLLVRRRTARRSSDASP